jgi:glycosyltransferase involved in cell wall biosynthesis
MKAMHRKAAHFLLVPELSNSPPNEAIIGALLAHGFEVDLYAPGGGANTQVYGPRVKTQSVEYGRRWLLRVALDPKWRQYSVFSGTSEDPMAVVGTLAWLHRKPSFLLADEIKSGSYSGDSPAHWKWLCRWAMRRARFNIVNDVSRVPLLRQYAALSHDAKLLVYPGCFRIPPAAADREALRSQWGIDSGDTLIAASGGFNMTNGAEWLVQALQRDPSLHAVVQPLGMDSFARFLLNHVENRDRLYVEERRLGWFEAWSTAAAFDIGLAVYTNPAPQFQHMGISSNRLCMFLAMGVPVIASRQPSFEFLTHYDCGVMVESLDEFIAAVNHIRRRPEMRANALRCAKEYINAPGRYRLLEQAIAALSP